MPGCVLPAGHLEHGHPCYIPVAHQDLGSQLQGLARVRRGKGELGALFRDMKQWRANLRALPVVEANFKVPVVKLGTPEETAFRVASEIANIIRDRHDHGGAVLGLATGSTPLAVYRELIRFMQEERTTIQRALNLLFIAQNLERIADHATNLAEDVLFLVKGIDVRHHAEAREAL